MCASRQERLKYINDQQYKYLKHSSTKYGFYLTPHPNVHLYYYLVTPVASHTYTLQEEGKLVGLPSGALHPLEQKILSRASAPVCRFFICELASRRTSRIRNAVIVTLLGQKHPVLESRAAFLETLSAPLESGHV